MCVFLRACVAVQRVGRYHAPARDCESALEAIILLGFLVFLLLRKRTPHLAEPAQQEFNSHGARAMTAQECKVSEWAMCVPTPHSTATEAANAPAVRVARSSSRNVCSSRLPPGGPFLPTPRALHSADGPPLAALAKGGRQKARDISQQARHAAHAANTTRCALHGTAERPPFATVSWLPANVLFQCRTSTPSMSAVVRTFSQSKKQAEIYSQILYAYCDDFSTFGIFSGFTNNRERRATGTGEPDQPSLGVSGRV